MLGESRRRGMGSIGTVAVCVGVLAAGPVTGCTDSESPAALESVPSAGLAVGESQAAERDLGAVIGRLVGESGLTDEQVRAISALPGPASVPPEPRESWQLAAELSGILTDEQVLSIEQSMESARESRRARSRAKPGDGPQGEGRRGHRGHRLREESRIGDPDAGAVQRMEERRARREARRDLELAAMSEVLELTEDQREAVRALAAERPDSAAAGPAWRESRREA